MLLDIRPDHLQIVQTILQKHVPQYAVWAFGSRAKWTAKDYSDLDLCIVSDKPLSFSLLGAIAEDFSDSDLPWKVDVVDWATTSEGFRKIIERDKVVLQKVNGGNGAVWRNITFGEFVALQRGHDLPDQDRRPGVVPILGSFGITGFHDTVKANGPGVTIGRSGASFGVAAYTDKDYWPLNTALYVTDFKGNDPKFVYYFLRDFDFSGYNSGSAQPSLNRNNLYGIPVRIPPPLIQKQIAQFVSALDNRITLLRETNATLEAIAQALFKSWFVDFDPVHAKQQGRAPEGMDEATAALFPDSFEESELGLVPKGWRVGMLCELARLHKEASNPLKHPEILFEHYSLPAFDNGQTPVFEAGIEIKSNKTVVPSDAVLLSKLNPHIPRVWLPTNSGLNAVCSTEFLAFVPINGVSRDFVFCTFSTAQFQQALCQLVTGTSNSHQRVRPDGVLAMASVIPTTNVLAKFAEVINPIFDRIGHNRHKAQTLATLRDTLLPRLISGQLRLPEAEAATEEIA